MSEAFPAPMAQHGADIVTTESIATLDPELQAAVTGLRERLTLPFFAERPVLEAMASLATRLYPEAATYDTVIGDDVSGHLPTLAYCELLNLARRDHDLKPLTVRFMNGRYSGPMPNDFLPATTDKESRTLILTEFMLSGSTVMNMYRAAISQRELGTVDVAAISNKGGKHYGADMAKDSRLYVVPESFAAGNWLHGELIRKYTGLAKEPYEPFAHSDPNAHMPFIQAGLRETSLIADGLYQTLSKRR